MPADSVVSDALVLARGYGRNVTALTRHIPLVLCPHSEDEVRRIVSLARAHSIALYPFSSGKNWGLGSKLPVLDGSVLVDLSRLNRIIDVNEAFGYAIIEPGVTQGQLATYLQNQFPHLTMNFTGSSAQTSIVGNVLERGDGGYARVHDLLGVRGILGNGKPFHTGGVWNYVGSPHPSHHSKYTAGPDLTGMFTQSNFGIVTQMAFRLMHKPQSSYIFWGVVPDENLEHVVDTFDYFGAQGAINRGSVNIGYANRFVQTHGTLRDEGEHSEDDHSVWNFYVLVRGIARPTDALIEELHESFTPLCTAVGAFRVGANADPYTELPAFLHPLVQPLMGAPDTASITSIYVATGTPLPLNPHALDVDQTPFGMKCYIPVIPPRGEYARRAAGVVATLREQFGLTVKLSICGDGCALITIHFRVDDAEQVRRAEMCEAKTWEEMVGAGFPPYRVSIDQMRRLVDLDPEFFDMVAQLKSALDPGNIMSPGRYSPAQIV